ncbi:MAG: ABC transporter ATP-binding protein [Gemmatimonadota bacterium]|nr:ABC transporter ATP-binding protein [Gemmatimonadota bacterium]
MASPAPAIVLENVEKRFGRIAALDGIDLHVPGGAVALLGPNGAGKSTLLRVVAALSKPTHGRIFIRGVDVRKEPERVRADIGLISHQTLLYEDLTAGENLRFYGCLYGLDDLKERVRQALAEVGLSGREHDRVRGFSRGMKQRLAVARATLHGPTILLLDEPFAGLDAAACGMLSERLHQIRREGRTVILVTHDLRRCLDLADRFAILNRGRLVETGETRGLSNESLKRRYKNATNQHASAIPVAE